MIDFLLLLGSGCFMYTNLSVEVWEVWQPMVGSGPQDSVFPGLVDCGMFFDKTHYSHSASLHSVMYMGTGKCNTGGGGGGRVM